MRVLDNAVYVDWKSESADILFALREKYSDELPCVLQSNYDELAENYAVEQPESFLDALGQDFWLELQKEYLRLLSMKW